jgi:hypothetical protein
MSGARFGVHIGFDMWILGIKFLATTLHNFQIAPHDGHDKNHVRGEVNVCAATAT